MRLVDPTNTNLEAVAVYAETSLGTHFAVSIHTDATAPQLISKLEVEHYNSFCEFGQVKITALQVTRGCHLYRLSHSVPLRLFFESCNAWFVHVVAFQISTREPSRHQETARHSTTEKTQQEKTPICQFSRSDIGNRVVKAAERLHPCPKRLKLSKLALESENRYTAVMANAFSFK